MYQDTTWLSELSRSFSTRVPKRSWIPWASDNTNKSTPMASERTTYQKRESSIYFFAFFFALVATMKGLREMSMSRRRTVTSMLSPTFFPAKYA